MMAMLFQFIVAHALCDFVLQRKVMAISKNRHAEIFKTAGKGFPAWYYWLGAHALIHGGAVMLISGSVLLGVIETVLHFSIDFAKCEHWIGLHVDQSLHLLCKLVYVYAIYQAWV